MARVRRVKVRVTTQVDQAVARRTGEEHRMVETLVAVEGRMVEMEHPTVERLTIQRVVIKVTRGPREAEKVEMVAPEKRTSLLIVPFLRVIKAVVKEADAPFIT